MRFLFVVVLLFLAGCSSLQKKKNDELPSVSTGQVIKSLNDTKTELIQAGEANTKVAKNIEKALTLAERLDLLLEQIEKEQNRLVNKNVVKPIK